MFTRTYVSGLSFIYYIYLYLFMFKLIYDESGAPVFFPDDIPGSQNIISLSPASGLHAVIFYRYISYAAVAMDSHEPPHERDDDDERA